MGIETGGDEKEVGCAFSQTRTLAIGLVIGCTLWIVTLIGCLIVIAGLLRSRPW